MLCLHYYVYLEQHPTHHATADSRVLQSPMFTQHASRSLFDQSLMYLSQPPPYRRSAFRRQLPAGNLSGAPPLSDSLDSLGDSRIYSMYYGVQWGCHLLVSPGPPGHGHTKDTRMRQYCQHKHYCLIAGIRPLASFKCTCLLVQHNNIHILYSNFTVQHTLYSNFMYCLLQPATCIWTHVTSFV